MTFPLVSGTQEKSSINLLDPIQCEHAVGLEHDFTGERDRGAGNCDCDASPGRLPDGGRTGGEGCRDRPAAA